jgi:hypothetical protein
MPHPTVPEWNDRNEVGTADQQADHFLINLTAFFNNGRFKVSDWSRCNDRPVLFRDEN